MMLNYVHSKTQYDVKEIIDTNMSLDKETLLRDIYSDLIGNKAAENQNNTQIFSQTPIADLVDAICTKVNKPAGWEGDWENFCDACDFDEAVAFSRNFNNQAGKEARFNSFVILRFHRGNQPFQIYFNVPTIASKEAQEKKLEAQKERLRAIAKKLKVAMDDLEPDDSKFVDTNFNVINMLDRLDAITPVEATDKEDTLRFRFKSGDIMRPFLKYIGFGIGRQNPLEKWDNIQEFKYGHPDSALYSNSTWADTHGDRQYNDKIGGTFSFYQVYNEYVNNELRGNEISALRRFLDTDESVLQFLQDLNELTANDLKPDEQRRTKVKYKQVTGVVDKKDAPEVSAAKAREKLFDLYPALEHDVENIKAAAAKANVDLKDALSDKNILRNYKAAMDGNNIDATRSADSLVYLNERKIDESISYDNNKLAPSIEEINNWELQSFGTPDAQKLKSLQLFSQYFAENLSKLQFIRDLITYDIEHSNPWDDFDRAQMNMQQLFNLILAAYVKFGALAQEEMEHLKGENIQECYKN